MVDLKKVVMGRAILSGNPPISLSLRRSARARRISLRISRSTGRVTLTMPTHVPDSEALDFAREKENWLRGHLSQIGGESVLTFGTRMLWRGQSLDIVPGQGRKIIVSDGAIHVPGDVEQIGARLQAYAKAQARDALAAASDRYAAQLGRSYSKLTLRDTRSRWGSCNSRGELMYSWRLILAPDEVLDYVAAHEVAHLAEMNHSPAFWSVVERLCPDYVRHRGWLKSQGHLLHQTRFG